MRTQKPCRVCGNKTKGEINRHHLLPKCDRQPGTRQVTIRLCKDQFGCRAHHRFHAGEKKAAYQIRAALSWKELDWMQEQVGWEWVQTIYPAKKR